MASDVVSEAIEAFIGANWTATPVRFENTPLDRPFDSNGGTLPWVDVEMTGTLYAQESIGETAQADNLWNEEGQLWLHVLVAVDTGSKIARNYATQLANLFRGLRLVDDNLEFLNATIGMGRPGDDNGLYWAIDVEIDWRRWDA